MSRSRLLVCVFGVTLAVGLSHAQPPPDLTASFNEGSTKSSIVQKATWEVTDTVTNTTAKILAFSWDAENKSPFAAQVGANGGTTTQKWNLAANASPVGSTKGGIKLTDPANMTTVSYTAQKYIPKQPPGGGGLQSKSKFGLFGRRYVSAQVSPVFPLWLSETPLFGEFAVDDKPLFRVESRAVDLTGAGDYVLAVVAYNATDVRLSFRSEGGMTLVAPPGEFAVQWYDGGGAWDAVSECDNEWEVTAEVGKDRFATVTIRGHLWTIAR